MVYWFAGQRYDQNELSLAPSHPALAYGASVFTTLRVYHQSLEHPLTAWDYHCDRITDSLAAFGWPAPDWSQIVDGCRSLMQTYPVLRLAVFADGQELITGRYLPQELQQQQRSGVTVWVAADPKYRRSLPAHKTGCYLPCWLALQAAQRRGARDAILVSAADEWLETSTGNLWGYHQGRWWTPPLTSGLLPGISRRRLLETGDIVSDIPWDANLVDRFDCLAYSNCVVEILPIHTVQLENLKLNYNSTHVALSALRQKFSEAVRGG